MKLSIDWLKYKRMQCNLCTECFEHPETPGRCLYGGPYSHYQKMEWPEPEIDVSIFYYNARVV